MALSLKREGAFFRVIQEKNRCFWTLGENWVKENAESCLPIIGEGTIIASCESDLK